MGYIEKIRYESSDLLRKTNEIAAGTKEIRNYTNPNNKHGLGRRTDLLIKSNDNTVKHLKRIYVTAILLAIGAPFIAWQIIELISLL